MIKLIKHFALLIFRARTRWIRIYSVFNLIDTQLKRAGVAPRT